jgi:protein-S-isoprenylcysteine O-methyltransferase Ste14
MKSPLNRGGLRFYLILVALVALAAGYSTNFSIFCGSLLIILGIFLHIWAKGCLRQNREVTMTGPYRFVRHPFYAANALIDAGIGVMSGWWLLMLVLPGWWLSIYIPKIRSEENYLSTVFPEIYKSYKQQVPMLVPYHHPLPQGERGFSWSNPNIASGREISRVLRFISYPLLFFILKELRTKGWVFFSDNYSLEFTALMMLFVLYGFAWMLTRNLKLGRQIVPKVLSSPQFRILIAISFFVLTTVIYAFETEVDSFVIPAGLAVLVLSAISYFYLKNPIAHLIAEGTALIGAALFCELVWLIAWPILYYGALLLDTKTTERSRIFQQPKPTYYFIFLIGAVLAGVMKEVLLDSI